MSLICIGYIKMYALITRHIFKLVFFLFFATLFKLLMENMHLCPLASNYAADCKI